MFEEHERAFEGPNGVVATFAFRADTADENTIQATFSEDEYKFALKPPADGQWMIDLGGYIGSTAILWAKLYPKSKVVVVEPIPENALLIRANIERNGLTDQIILIEKAIAEISGEQTNIYYRDATTVGMVHRFIGSGYKAYHETVAEEHVSVETITLDKIIEDLKIESVRVLKMDAEGAEYVALRGCNPQNLAKIQTIVGEYHNVRPASEGFPRTLLFNLTQDLFIDRSETPEETTWGAFLFERKNNA